MKLFLSNICRMTLATAAALALHSKAAWADENGVSLWVPGLFGSLFWLGLIWITFLALGAWVVERREYVLEQ